MGADTSRRDAALAVIRLSERLSWQISRLLASEKLTMPQYNILRILRGAKGEALACGTIGSRLLTPVPDLTRVLDRLERSALVQRVRDNADRRVVRVTITPKGLEILRRLDKPVGDLHAGHFPGLTDRQVEQLRKLADKALTGLD